MKNSFSKTPIFRLLAPFVIGILAASSFSLPNLAAIIITIISGTSYIIATTLNKATLRLTASYIIGLPLFLLCCSMGALCYNLNQPSELARDFPAETIAEGTITKLIDNDYSTKLQLHVTAVIDTSSNRTTTINQKITAWMEGNDYSLKEGDIIAFIFRPTRITNSGNPEEFDYAKYMRGKGFLYHSFINRYEYTKIGTHTSIFTLAQNIQRKLINLILDSKLNNDSKTFFITILLGDSTLLDYETREIFSLAGISHILALSGMHIGIISLLLNILLLPLDYLKLKRIRHIITLIAIIIFSFIAGLPISVTRATLMIGFVIIAKISYRKNNSLNALLASALFILIFNPNALFEIGFQLSFISVLTILSFSNRLNFVSPKKELLFYITSTVGVSVITAFGTMWLTAFYFNYISFYSILTNTLIIPTLPFIIGGGLLHITLLYMGIECNILTSFLDKSYSSIIELANNIINLPGSYSDNVFISFTMLCLCLITSIALIIFIFKRRIIYFYCILIGIVSISALYYIEIQKSPNCGYIIYSDLSCTPVLTFNNGKANIWCPDDTLDIGRFKRYNKGFLAKFHINEISINDTTSTIHQAFHPPYTCMFGKRVGIISDNSAKRVIYMPKIKLDFLIVTKKYYGNIENLIRSYDTKLVVLASDIFHKQLETFKAECDSLNINHHSIKDDGAIYKFYK